MVDLPRYVKVRTKPNGRVFYHYERYRGTSRAWPRLALPFHPQAPEFWQRCRQCEALDAREADGAWSWAWIGPTGRRYALPDPAAGIAAFWTAVDVAERQDGDREGLDRKTFRALIALYKDHASYLKLAVLTKRDYDRHLDSIEEVWGDDPVAHLTAPDAQKAIDAYQATPAVARYFRAVLSRLVAFGIPRGFAGHNVVEATEKVEHEAEPFKPWADWAFELFFEHARVGLHLPVYSALYTGQRSVDVIPMGRPALGANAVELVARKTGANVYVPIHSEYRQALAAAHVEHPQLHLREDGEPWTLAGYRTAWQRELALSPTDEDLEAASPEVRAKVAAMKRLREAGVVFHGLRKNAVNMLLEAGCTEAEVSAIVEMSEQMVRHYARDVNKRRLARNAMRKLEDGWAEARERLFGAPAEGGFGNREADIGNRPPPGLQ